MGSLNNCKLGLWTASSNFTWLVAWSFFSAKEQFFFLFLWVLVLAGQSLNALALQWTHKQQTLLSLSRVRLEFDPLLQWARVEAFLWWVSNMHDILEIPADTKQPLSAWLSGQFQSVPDFVHISPKQQKHQRCKKTKTKHQESYPLSVLSKSCLWPIVATLRTMQGSLCSSARVLIKDLSNMSAHLSTHLCTTLVFP